MTMDADDRKELEELRLAKQRQALLAELRGEIDQTVEARVKAELAGVNEKLDRLLDADVPDDPDADDTDADEEEAPVGREPAEPAAPQEDEAPVRSHPLNRRLGGRK